MALIPSFLKGKNKKDNNPPSFEKISIASLEKLIPIRNLCSEKLQSFISNNKAIVFPAGKTLFKYNQPANSAVYLLKGTVTLIDDNKNSFDVDSSEAKAKFPLSSGVKYTTTAVSKTKVSLLHVSQKIMSSHSIDHNTDFIIPEDQKSNQLLHSFAQYFHDDELEIPTLPTVAIQLRKAMKKDIGIEEAVKIIQLDPVISAKLIEVANCPLYIAITPVKSCFEAVNRIGLNSTRSLVVSLSIKNIFKSRSPVIKKLLDDVWKDSLYLSSLSYVLATISNQKKPEEAQLAGLVCNIGIIPFLNFVTNLPSDFYTEEDIKSAIPIIKGVVGASILQKWDFTDEFIQVPLMSENWFHSTDENTLSYTDIVMLSKLHHHIGKKDNMNLPPITAIPAASKLTDVTLSPENSLNILHEAKNKVNEAIKSFYS